mmetsp:Transcript_45751/g.123360  ORF Transcript_45751/g.123360 Transcript_45751/m.123360 type:complete len:280 (-) Transcript_45751:769-1608(-)
MAPAGFLLAAVLLAASGSEGMQISQGYQSGEVLLSVAGGASPTARDGKSAHPQTVSLLQTIADSQIGVFNEQVDVSGQGDSRTLVKQLFVPVMALILGLICLQAKGALNTMGKIMVYFGAQTFMNLYMKAVLSNSMVSQELHMRGFQAPLVLTALQQLVGFCLLALGILVSQLTPWAYRPQAIVSKDQISAVMALAVCFTLNIALNNFSLSLLDMSVNVMVRSTSPLVSLLLQLCFRKWFDNGSVDTRPGKVGMMLLGVVCAALVVISKSAQKKTTAQN